MKKLKPKGQEGRDEQIFKRIHKDQENVQVLLQDQWTSSLIGRYVSHKLHLTASKGAEKTLKEKKIHWITNSEDYTTDYLKKPLTRRNTTRTFTEKQCKNNMVACYSQHSEVEAGDQEFNLLGRMF